MGTSSDCYSCLKSVPQRYIISGMIFFAIVGLLMMRTCMSMTLTQMVKPTLIVNNIHIDETACPMPAADLNFNGTIKPESTITEKFDWSQQLQGMILSSFYVGYVLLHVPGGVLAEKIGGKPVIVGALVISGILSIATPLIVHTGGATALIVLRITLGIVQAGFFPAVAMMLSAWVPCDERGRIGSLVYCGLPCGAIIGNFTAGFLLHNYQNWHGVFYICGTIGTIMSLLFALICTDNPSTHPRISDQEKQFLRKQMGQLNVDEKKLPTPWKAILTSSPVLALIATEALSCWAYFVVMIDLPKYMNDVLHVSVRENGFYSSVPWIVFVLVSFISGYVSDWLTATNRLSITNTRKLLVIISSTIDGSFLMAAAYAGCDAMVVGAFFAAAVGAGGLQTASIMVNPLDLSPNYSGMITGIAGAIASIMGVVVPLIIGVIAPNSLQSEWRHVFWITFLTHIVKVFIFTIWGSGRIQTWDSQSRSMKEVTADLIEKNTNRENLKK